MRPAAKARSRPRKTPGVFRACSVLFLLAAVAVTRGVPEVRAQAGTSREYEIKAAFLYNFVKFVEWPPQALPASRPTITIGILGKDPFGPALNSITGKQVKGKTLAVRHLAGASARDLQDVQILFISASEQERVRQILESVRNQSILTVGEMKGFAETGGIINLTTQSNKVRFEINPSAAQRAGLEISSQLLKLAKVVPV